MNEERKRDKSVNLKGDKRERREETRKLMETFCRSRPHRRLVEKLVSRDDVYPYLWQIVKKDKFWRRNGVGKGWPPVHTLYLLGLKGGKKSFEIFKWMIQERVRELGDSVPGELYPVFYSFLPDFFEEVRSIALDLSFNKYVRLAALASLCTLTILQGEKKEEVVATCRQFMRKGERDIAALALPHVAEIKDKALFRDVKRFFYRHPYAKRVISLQDLRKLHKGTSEHPEHTRCIEDLWGYFPR